MTRGLNEARQCRTLGHRRVPVRVGWATDHIVPEVWRFRLDFCQILRRIGTPFIGEWKDFFKTQATRAILLSGSTPAELSGVNHHPFHSPDSTPIFTFCLPIHPLKDRVCLRRFLPREQNPQAIRRYTSPLALPIDISFRL
jgi:hypothetical protein